MGFILYQALFELKYAYICVSLPLFALTTCYEIAKLSVIAIFIDNSYDYSIVFICTLNFILDKQLKVTVEGNVDEAKSLQMKTEELCMTIFVFDIIRKLFFVLNYVGIIHF